MVRPGGRGGTLSKREKVKGEGERRGGDLACEACPSVYRTRRNTAPPSVPGCGCPDANNQALLAVLAAPRLHRARPAGKGGFPASAVGTLVG